MVLFMPEVSTMMWHLLVSILCHIVSIIIHLKLCLMTHLSSLHILYKTMRIKQSNLGKSQAIIIKKRTLECILTAMQVNWKTHIE